MIEFEQALAEILAELGIFYNEEMIRRSADYASYLLEENQKMNLTAITVEREMAVKHFADSLCLLKYVDLPQGATLIDVGSGAGFPGMVLKIFRSDLKITLLDSLKKRCGFLTRLAAEIGVDDVTIVWGRAEDAGREAAYRGQFDFAVARAVAPLPVLLEYCTPFIKVNGTFLAMKAKKELGASENALLRLHCRVDAVQRYTLDGDDRTIIPFQKTAPTPAQYPRRAGIPERKPL